MARDGIDIMDSDEAKDVHYLYFERYNAGDSPAEINQWFEENNPFIYKNKVIEDASDFWLALALAQWEVKATTSFVLERVIEIIQKDIEKEDFGTDYPDRKKVLESFLKKIQKEKKTAQKPVKQKLFKAPFIKGDVITYPVINPETYEYTGKWGLSICLENTQGLQKTASCLFARTLIEKDQSATIEDIHSAYLDPYGWNGVAIIGAAICDMDDVAQLKRLKKIGKIEIHRSFFIDGYPFGGWDFCFCSERERMQAENPEKATAVKITDLIQIPSHPYSQWVEKIISLKKLSYEEEPLNTDKFKEVADFLLEIRHSNEKTYQEEFIPFLEKYIMRERKSTLRKISIGADYDGGTLE